MLDPNVLILLKHAVEQRQQVAIQYSGLVRYICPHMLGIAKGGKGAVIHAFQFGDANGTVDPTTGSWKFFYCDKLEGGLTVRDGPWYPQVDLAKAEVEYKQPAFVERVIALAPRVMPE